MIRAAQLMALLVALLVAGAAAADSPKPEGWAYDLAGYLMSPYCPGRTLADCPSPQAQTLRMWLIVQEAAGRSQDEVEQELYARFGDQIRPAPRAEGFGLTAYAVPIGAFLAGGLLVFLYLRTHTRGGSGPGAGPPAAPVDPALERLVDEDLAR